MPVVSSVLFKWYTSCWSQSECKHVAKQHAHMTLFDSGNMSGHWRQANAQLTASSKFWQKKAVFLSWIWRSLWNGTGLVSPLWHSVKKCGLQRIQPSSYRYCPPQRESNSEFLQCRTMVQRWSFARVLLGLVYHAGLVFWSTERRPDMRTSVLLIHDSIISGLESTLVRHTAVCALPCGIQFNIFFFFKEENMRKRQKRIWRIRSVTALVQSNTGCE